MNPLSGRKPLGRLGSPPAFWFCPVCAEAERCSRTFWHASRNRDGKLGNRTEWSQASARLAGRAGSCTAVLGGSDSTGLRRVAAKARGRRLRYAHRQRALAHGPVGPADRRHATARATRRGLAGYRAGLDRPGADGVAVPCAATRHPLGRPVSWHRAGDRGPGVRCVAVATATRYAGAATHPPVHDHVGS